MSHREEDGTREMFVCSSHDYVLFFSNRGRVYRLKCYEIPEGSRTSRGTNLVNLLPIEGEERITSMIRVSEFGEDQYLSMITREGIIKRTRLCAYDTARKGGLIAIDLDDGDELCWVRCTGGEDELLAATRGGMAIRIRESDVRVVGRTARGVKLMELADGDCIAGVAVIDPARRVMTVSETGYGRVSDIDDYRLQNRGGKGLKNYAVDRYGMVADVVMVSDDDDVILISSDGVMIRIPASEIRVCRRPSKGVRVMRVGDGARVVTVTRTAHDAQEVNASVEDDGSADADVDAGEDE